MQKSQFKQAYHAARIGQINENTLEGVAAIIAVQDARTPDLIGKVYRDARDFLEFIEERHEKRERLAELKSRRRVRRAAYDRLEFEPQDVPVYHDDMLGDFESVYADR